MLRVYFLTDSVPFPPLLWKPTRSWLFKWLELPAGPVFSPGFLLCFFPSDSASLTLIWASWIGYLQTCFHRSRWLKGIGRRRGPGPVGSAGVSGSWSTVPVFVFLRRRPLIKQQREGLTLQTGTWNFIFFYNIACFNLPGLPRLPLRGDFWQRKAHQRYRGIFQM